MKRIFGWIFLFILLLGGTGLLLYPVWSDWTASRENDRQIEVFEKKTSEVSQDQDRSKQLYDAMQAYNEQIFREGQSGMTDAWDAAESEFDFRGTGLEEGVIGSITVPAMDICLPLYIGANEENLKEGAAVLSETSMPVGGENTNCVIAAHRGYAGAAMFRDIEILKPGDQVEIKNLWETLEYEVVKCIAIYPDNIDAVKIIPGEDMVTLITCHPYTKNYQRYVVYCRRSGTETQEKDSQELDRLLDYDGVDYISSEPEIEQEKWMRRIAVGAAAILFIGALIILVRQIVLMKPGRRKKRKRK